MAVNYYIKEEENKREESLNNYKYLFSYYEKNIPSLNEALNQMFKSVVFDDNYVNNLTADIMTKCINYINNKFYAIEQKYKNISIYDAYIICSYTCESFNRQYSPFKLLNRNLVSDNRKQGVANISKYLFIFLKSLRKLDRYYPTQEKKYLFRCIKDKVSLEKKPDNDKLIPYIIGDQRTFWGFTSTSPDPKITINFLGENQLLKTGTIFTLTGEVWGYDITLFNYYNEEEIILEPETKFIVDNIIPSVNDIIHITCNVLRSPLILDPNGVQLPPIIANNISINNQENNNLLNFINYIVKIEGEIKKDNVLRYTKNIGYLCNVNAKNINVLITSKKLESLDEINKLKININNKEIDIDMRINRYKYTDNKLDITIIEILEQDNIYTFLDIDRFIDTKNYINENIEAFYLQNGDFLRGINGIIIKKNSNNNYICNIKSINNGIIILRENSKLIGLIKENNNNNLIEVIPMNIIINNINYIKCIYDIKIEKKDEEIQILNNKYYYDQYFINEEILNKINVIINGEIQQNILTYTFNKEGSHNIYITFNNLMNNMAGMFLGCSSLKEIDLSFCNTSQVTNMSSMFYGCSSLEKIYLSSIITEQVTDMNSMFYGCKSLKELNLSSFNTNQVTNMSYMLSNCSSLKELDLSSFNTINVTNMNDMFSGCTSLKQISLSSSFNTIQVTNMSGMFSNCSNLKELNLSTFNTEQVIYMNWMFSGCSGLEKLNLSSFNTNKVIDMSGMFFHCYSLKELYLSSSFNTLNETDVSDMFDGCSLELNCNDQKIKKQLNNVNECCIIV